MRALVLLVLAEFVVLVLLAMQWLGSGTTAVAGDRPAPPTTPPTEAAAGVAAAMPPANGSVPANAPVERRAAAEQVPAVAAGDAIGIIVSGTIRSSDGTLIEGARVGLRRDRDYRSGNSAAPGAYAIAGLQPGEWTLWCRADGYAQHEAPCVLDERAFQRVDVELKPCWIVRVKVQDADGKSIFQELQQKTMFGVPYAVATEAPLAGDLPPTENTRLHRFGLGEWHSYDGMSGNAQPKLIEQGYTGELRMNRAPPAHASLLLRTIVLQGQPIAAGQKELVFTIEAKDVLSKHGTVRVRLVDGTTGKPIAGVGINVSTAQGGGAGGKTDDDGRATIEHVPPGIGTLESWQRSQEHEGLQRYIRVEPGATLDLGDVTLTAAEKVAGVVVDADGKPVNGASVQWTELDCRTFPQSLVDNRSSVADAEGKFQLGVGRHRYVVIASGRNGVDVTTGFATVDATHGAPTPVTITLGKPTNVKLNAGFDMTVGRMVTVLASDRSPVAVATLGTEYRPPSMSLLPGNYTIEIHDLQTCRLVRSLQLQVGSEPLTLDVP